MENKSSNTNEVENSTNENIKFFKKYKQKNVIWIDQNNDKMENKTYLQEFSKELNDFSFTLVTSVKEGYICLNKFKFELIDVILSYRLAEEF